MAPPSAAAGPSLTMAQKLLDPSLTPEAKLKLVLDIRENIDSLSRDASAPFAEHIMPAALQLLQTGPISLMAHSPEHKLRFTLVDLIHRLPATDAMRPFLPDLHSLLIKLIREDSEEVANTAFKTLVEVHRHYKDALQTKVNEPLDFVKDLFSNMPDVVAQVFDAPPSSTGGDATAPPAVPSQASAQHQPLPIGSRSFKLAAEAPIVVVFLLQAYREILPSEMPVLLPLIFKFLDLQPAAQGQWHQDAEARGELVTDVCPALNNKREEFSALLIAQVKAISFVAYTYRFAASTIATFRSKVPAVVIRMLKDFPCESTTHRRELLVALRHVLATDLRANFVPYTNVLMDERILIGTGVTAHESLRQVAYGMIADYIHHIRADLTSEQFSKVIHFHSCIMHDLTLPFAIHSMCSKLLSNLIPSVVHKEREDAIALLKRVFEATVRKMETLAIIKGEWERWTRPREEKDSPEGRVKTITEGEEGPVLDDIDVERQRPVGPIYPIAEPETDVVKGTLLFFIPDLYLHGLADFKALFKNLLTTVKSLVTNMQHIRPDALDATVLARVFVSGIRCFVMLEKDAKPTKESREELKELFDMFTEILTLKVDMLTFNAMWETDFYFTPSPEYYEVGQDVQAMPILEVFVNESLESNGDIYVVLQNLLGHKEYSHAFTGIVVRYLMKQLHVLESTDKSRAAAINRMFKMCLMAVSMFPPINESVLTPHVSSIVSACLKYTNERPEPLPYFFLLRNLFRSIAGGKFEQLYQAVLPYLHSILERLHMLLETSDRVKRDVFVEICLTVPLKLSVLLPYLHYLMKPLAMALDCGHELAAQGMRMLELCLDNLSFDYFKSLLAPVRDEVFAALYKLLRPVPAGNPNFAHIALRLIGKMGGKGRRFPDHPKLEWRSLEEEAKLPVSFEGQQQYIKMAPVVELALRVLKRADLHYRKTGFNLLKNAATVFLTNPPKTSLQEETFSQILRGLMESAKAPELADEAKEYLLGLTSFIFETELGQQRDENVSGKQQLSCSSVLLDAMAENLAMASSDCLQDLQRAADQTKQILANLLESEKVKRDRAFVLLRQFASRLCAICYDHSWFRKAGGATGLHIITTALEMSPSVEWLGGHELEMVRALLFLIKDAPTEAPRPIERAIDTLIHVCTHTKIVDAPGEPTNSHGGYLISLIAIELSSQVSIVRSTVKDCLKIIAERRQCSLSDIIMPTRDRLLGPIFAKPLRALHFAMQIGHMDAITYCMSTEPPTLSFEFPRGGRGEGDQSQASQDGQPSVTGTPLPDGQGSAAASTPSAASQPNPTRDITSDQMVERLLTEALGIADAEDKHLVNKTDHQKSLLLSDLRVVCVDFLTAAFATRDTGNPRQNVMRSKIMQVFFKLLYRPEQKVVDATYRGLQMIINHHGKLPKEMLQHGLKPVLANLADHRKLDVPSLEGLARLLKLLTNYFRAEIGLKVLDHFKSIAGDVGVLTRAEMTPEDDNSPLKILSCIVNIFHLLPHPAAGTYLPDLCAQVVHVEKVLKKVGPTIFTNPLALYLDMYPEAATNLFVTRLPDDLAWCRTFVAVLRSDNAKALRSYVQTNAQTILLPLFGPDPRPPPSEGEEARPVWRGAQHAALILLTLARLDASWLKPHSVILGALVQRWVSPERKENLAAQNHTTLEQVAEDDAILEIFLIYLKLEDHVDMLFHCVEVFTIRTPTDHLALLRHIYLNVIARPDVAFKRRILDRFLDIFETPTVTESHKAAALKHLINPLLLVSLAKPTAAEPPLLDSEYIGRLHQQLWLPYLDETWVQNHVSSEPLKVELMYMTKLILRYQSSLIIDSKKEVIKFGWSHSHSHEAVIRYSAYSLIAQFLHAYESPPKIVILVYNTLLKAHNAEAKALVREGLAVLAPTLPIRGSFPDQSQTSWVKTTRSLLADEGQGSQSQMIHIYQYIVRQPDLFYPRRDVFTHHIIANISRLSTYQTSNSDSRSLAVDLFELLLRWEKTRISAEQQKTEGSKPDSTRAPSIAPSTASGSTQGAWQLTSAGRDQVISLLTKTILQYGEPQSKTTGCQRPLDLLRSFLATDLWPDVNIKLSIFQVPLMRTELNDANLPLYVVALKALDAIVRCKPAEWIQTNLVAVTKLIERSVVSARPALLDLTSPILASLFCVAKPADLVMGDKAPRPEGQAESYTGPTVATDTPSDEASRYFYEWAIGTTNEAFRTMTNFSSGITIVYRLVQVKPDAAEYFSAALIRVITRMTKEHMSNALADNLVGHHQMILQTTITLLEPRFLTNVEHRRWLLSALVQLIERSNSLSLCRFLLDLVTSWVFEGRRENFPTPKEKAGLLSKMMTFEGRHDEALLKDFLRVVLRIYKDPSLMRSELTVRLEQAFLLGCRNREASLRCEFMELFDQNISKSLFTRLHYLFGVQSWESLAEAIWVHQTMDLVLAAVDSDVALFRAANPSQLEHPFAISALSTQNAANLVCQVRNICYAEPMTTAIMWPSVFAASWKCLSHRQQTDITRFLVALLSKDYNLRCLDRRPNNVQILLYGLEACDNPKPMLPPHLLRHLGKTYNVWHTAAEMLQDAVESHQSEAVQLSSATGAQTVQEATLDALALLYSDLGEDDLFYGLWRRRCKFDSQPLWIRELICPTAFYPETNIALSFEQNGLWAQAQQMYEAAQAKARSGVMPFTESEYVLWEDQWLLCATKLQQWDVLGEVARQEGNFELALECHWRLSDWFTEREHINQLIDQLPPAPTPRRRIFEIFLQMLGTSLPGQDFQAGKEAFFKVCTNGIELALRKWYSLPERLSPAHVPILHTFQQIVELQETFNIFKVLTNTTAANYEACMSDVKTVLMSWRERLPNAWDDINIWSDLVAWRQHVFQAINRTLLPLLPPQSQQTQSGQASQANTSTIAYRGYHETAWTVNRFAHTARKHQLMDVCGSALNKIYTLPNIEIQEAFLKLREQAKSHYHQPGSNELTTGLEVINNTNLVYFVTSQKAEFFCLKGMFLARLGMKDEATTVFNQAITLDMNFAKGWAEWGAFNDRLFKENPSDINAATNALSCYLQAAGLYKNGKTRKLLVRILWLLSLDDGTGALAKAFDAYKGEVPVWYWITLIPQLLQALSRREAKVARIILLQIARNYPQSLFFQLRASRMEMDMTKRQYLKNKADRAARQRQEASADTNGDTEMGGTTPSQRLNGGDHPSGMLSNGQPMTPEALASSAPRQNPWDFVEEIHSTLKTSFPLLSLTMETMAEQLVTRFKPSHEEEMHRILYHLIHEQLIHALNKTDPNDNTVPESTVQNMKRFCDNITTESWKNQLTKDFIENTPPIGEFTARLQVWRDKFRAALAHRPSKQPVEGCSHWLVEFPYHRFDEVEVPGQYLQLEDSATGFVRIAYFQHKFDFQRLATMTVRRLTIVAHDGSQHPFAIQTPTPKHSRREERLIQLIRLLNVPLQFWKESRRRNLVLTAPVVVPLALTHRLVLSDNSMTSLQEIFEEHCAKTGAAPEDPVLAWAQAMRRIRALRGERLTEAQNETARLEVFNEIATKIFPDNILTQYMTRTMATASDLWEARRQMTHDIASFIVITFILFMGARTPLRIQISRSTGGFYTTDPLPSFNSTAPEFRHSEAVPFRFTPNMQRFVTAVGTEGRLTSAILAVARALLQTESDLEHRLSIFIKEEVLAWYHMHQKTPPENALRDNTYANIDTVIKRTKLLACSLEREKQPIGSVPVNQAILELLAQATNPIKLSATDITQLPWL